MTRAFETRRRRNGEVNLRDDMAALQKDFSQLTGDVGSVITQKWDGVGERFNQGAARVGKEVRAHPLAAVGIAAGAGLLIGLAAAATARRRR